MRVVPLIVVVLSVMLTSVARAEHATIAAAADLKFAMDEIVASFKTSNPGDEVVVIYGSSGKLHTQILEGAPYDLFFSADIAFPRMLAKKGLAASEVMPYAIGRIVLWSTSRDARQMTLASLADPGIRHIAIANPAHAPYGRRAEEALRALNLWDQVKPRLVLGENVTQAAQFVQSGNAEVGIISLSLALNRELARQGGYWLIPDNLHEPLVQGYVVTKHGQGNALAESFAKYVSSAPARAVMKRYGFVLPGEIATK